jgi:hypothetical protein
VRLDALNGPRGKIGFAPMKIQSHDQNFILRRRRLGHSYVKRDRPVSGLKAATTKDDRQSF